MASAKQKKAARASGKKTQQAAADQTIMTNLPKETRAAPGKQGAAAGRECTSGTKPRTRAELYAIARHRDLPGRSAMGRDELARRLGVS
jgi:hypothetical protein